MIIEIVKYKPKEGTPEKEFIQANRRMRDDFLIKQKGLVSHEFVRMKDGFADIMKWECLADADNVAKKFLSHPSAKRFDELIDSKSAEIVRADVI